VATNAELSKIRAPARATAIAGPRVNIRLSTGDLQDIQVKALQEGVPNQTPIASTLYKYVTGRLAQRDLASWSSAAQQDRAVGRREKRRVIANPTTLLICRKI
jgi:hypothetical protein